MIDFGTTPQHFHAELFEKNLHFRRGALGQSPYGWPDLDALLSRIEPVEPYFRMYRKGQLPAETYSEESLERGMQRRKLVRSRFDALMAGGATLVLNRLEGFSAPAQLLCAEVTRFTGHQATANGYLSVGGDGTFGQHWDVHDVFVLQLVGRKHWRVYPPTHPYPLSNQTSDRSPVPCPQTPVLEQVLETGDLLYIPRGWWHHATPLDGVSFHVSVAMFVPTILDYILWACGRYLPAQELARKSLGGGPGCMEEIAAAVQSASAALLDPRHVGDFMHMVRERQRVTADRGAAPGATSAVNCGLSKVNRG